MYVCDKDGLRGGRGGGRAEDLEGDRRTYTGVVSAKNQGSGVRVVGG